MQYRKVLKDIYRSRDLIFQIHFLPMVLYGLRPIIPEH